MRVASVFLIKNGRAPQNPNAVSFQEILPLRLKNRVSGKMDSISDVECLQEMAVLFACMKEKHFTQLSSAGHCSKEISAFQKCYKVHLDRNYQAKQADSQGIITPGKKLNYKQLNKYFRRYPNP